MKINQHNAGHMTKMAVRFISGIECCIDLDKSTTFFLIHNFPFLIFLLYT